MKRLYVAHRMEVTQLVTEFDTHVSGVLTKGDIITELRENILPLSGCKRVCN